MNTQTKQCQNCKADFVIEPADFEFYVSIKVPPPTFCPACRFQRRLMFLNIFTLYKRACDLCGKETFSVFSPDKSFVVYCNACWWSDKWDASDYAISYDLSRNFFEQVRGLQKKVPFPALFNNTPSLVNSPYNNFAANLKNCYLLFDAVKDENCYYSWMINGSKDSMDLLMIEKNELCYENVVCDRSYNTYFSEDIEDCRDVFFSKDMVGCSDCFGCANLRQKQYHIFNKPYTKEEYHEKLREFRLSSYRELEVMKAKTKDFWLQFPRKFIHGSHNTDVSGDYIFYSKNVHDSYIVDETEDSRFIQISVYPDVKRSYDCTTVGWSNYIYEFVGSGEVSNARFNCWVNNGINIDYSVLTIFGSNLLGCIGFKQKKENCILNKQYSKEDFEKLRAEIIESINKNPYVDSKKRVFRYGEFFPYDLSYFDYNETLAQNFFPLSQEQVKAHGWRWKEREKKDYEITKDTGDLVDDITDVKDDITKEVIRCAQCKGAYQIIPGELVLLRRFGFPLPRECFWCRNRRRFLRLNPPRFYRRACAKCKKEIITAYDPEKPEIVYCESCYLSEVV